MTDKVSEELSKAYVQMRLRQTLLPKTWKTTNEYTIILDALRDQLAATLRAEAWLRWFMNNKEGPSPSLATDWQSVAEQKLRG